MKTCCPTRACARRTARGRARPWRASSDARATAAAPTHPWATRTRSARAQARTNSLRSATAPAATRHERDPPAHSQLGDERLLARVGHAALQIVDAQHGKHRDALRIPLIGVAAGLIVDGGV